MAVERGAHVIRTHDVAETRDAALIGRAFARERVRTDGVEELDVRTEREADRHLERLGLAGEAAEESVSRTFAISGLGPADRDRLLAATEESGVTAVADGERGFLAGTRAGLKRLTADLDRLEPLRDAIRR
jgi:dihydropteroate synthase